MAQHLSDANKNCFTANVRMLGGGGVDGGIAYALLVQTAETERLAFSTGHQACSLSWSCAQSVKSQASSLLNSVQPYIEQQVQDSCKPADAILIFSMKDVLQEMLE